MKQLYLTSGDYYSFSNPRRILNHQKILLDNRNVLVVDVDDPLIGQEYGWGGEDITRFYLVNRHDQTAFEKLDEFPIHVHVLIQAKPHLPPPKSLKELQNIAWACLFDGKESAEKYAII